MQQHRKGHLKIFFSYAENIGKTQRMLRAAQLANAQGMKVVVGYIAPHTSKETLRLLEGLKEIPPLRINGADEFDLDAALACKSDLVVVDELEHSNPKDCRHRKRYQDVDELLKSGIDVYSTVNVGSIESLQDMVASITGTGPSDRIPDFVFDNADQVELIDIEPLELIERLKEADTPETQNTVEQLTALREVALRRCADRVKRISDRLKDGSGFYTDEHILVCLSTSPSNEKIIRTAARMAKAFNSQFTALFVQTPDFEEETSENKQRLRDHLRLAGQLGANIETVFGEDVPYQIAAFARISGITKIVLGRSAVTRRYPFGKSPLTEQLLTYVPQIDIHIIPDRNVNPNYRVRRKFRRHRREIGLNTLKTIGILMGATALSGVFDALGFTEANIIMVYILGVLMTSMATSHQIYSQISSIASVFIYNFLFTSPRFSLTAYEKGDVITFIVMFLTAYITGTFSIRYKEQAGQTAKVAYRTKILFDTDQLLSKAKNKDEIFRTTVEQILKLMGRDIVLFEVEDGKLDEPKFFPASGHSEVRYEDEQERETVEWVLKNNHAAGANTDTLSDSRYLYLALRVKERVYGVVGIEAKDNPLDSSEYGILLSILSECALALENDKNAREKEAAAVLAESEQLRANLLRTISHDLRTPLTTISGNAGSLLCSGDSFDGETKKRIYRDIYNDSMWLINLVENLLSATRIEEGRMNLQMSMELINDIVDDAMSHAERQNANHILSVRDDGNLLVAQLDARLIEQVLLNFIDNAMKYTPKGSEITVMTRKCGDRAVVSVADNGSGIPDAEKEKIFEKFYCGSSKIADNRRSLGLGLYLCKAIVEAHGGTISVEDNVPHGTIFSFALPLKEVTLYE